MKRISFIILAFAAFVTGCTREDVITPVTPSQSETVHVQRVFTERYIVLEGLDNLTGIWDTLSVVHTDKDLVQEWFWDGDRLDSIIDKRTLASTATIRFTYDDNGLLTRYEYFEEGSPLVGIPFSITMPKVV